MSVWSTSLKLCKYFPNDEWRILPLTDKFDIFTNSLVRLLPWTRLFPENLSLTHRLGILLTPRREWRLREILRNFPLRLREYINMCERQEEHFGFTRWLGLGNNWALRIQIGIGAGSRTKDNFPHQNLFTLIKESTLAHSIEDCGCNDTKLARSCQKNSRINWAWRSTTVGHDDWILGTFWIAGLGLDYARLPES